MKKHSLILLFVLTIIIGFIAVKYSDAQSTETENHWDMPTGTIVAFGGPKQKIPQGWIACDGMFYNRQDKRYAHLFKIIGVSWGAKSITDFAAPDLRGQFLRGVSEDSNIDPDANVRLNSRASLADKDYAEAEKRKLELEKGNSGNQVGSKQKDEFEKHHHEIGGRDWVGKGCNSTLSGCGEANIQKPTSEVGGNETRPVNAYVYYIIKL
jgi:hypothetical protein